MISEALAPMEMRAAGTIPEGPGWQYEPKWDGFRALAHRDGDHVAIVSKHGQPLARYFPEVVAALAALPAHRFVLDGELVVMRAGALSFDALQQRIHPAASRVASLAHATPAHFLAFDLLAQGEAAFLDRPLRERRAALERFARDFPPQGMVRLSPATTDRRVVERWFAQVGGALDGVVAKRLDAAYRSGERDGAVKVKKERTADCVVAGFRYAAGARDRIGSLLLGLYDPDGLLDYVGFCSAFPARERSLLLARLEPYTGGSGFSGSSPGGPSRWNRGENRDRSFVSLAPELVLEVAFDQVTGGRIRHGTRPVRWRIDKAPRTCTLDQLETTGNVTALL